MARRFNRHSNQKLSRGEPPNFSGQHFMHNKRLIKHIVSLAQIKAGDKHMIVEFGAGKGALTSELVRTGKQVLAIEWDMKLVEVLKQKYVEHTNLKVIRQDILQFVLPKQPFVLIANIPYAITTSIMKKICEKPTTNLQQAIIVMERGAAKRFTAPYIKDAYVVVWRMWFELQFVQSIAPANFSPPPKVDSAIMKVTRRDKPLINPAEHHTFRKLASFLLKTPTALVKPSLLYIFTIRQWKQLKQTARLSDEMTVERLTLEQWAAIHQTMVTFVPSYRWPK